jgi:hypothetical protein
MNDREASFVVAGRPTCAALDTQSASQIIGGGLMLSLLQLVRVSSAGSTTGTFWMIIRRAIVQFSGSVFSAISDNV